MPRQATSSSRRSSIRRVSQVEEGDDVLIGGRRERLVELSDGEERRLGADADDLVGMRLQLLERGRGRDRHAKHDVSRAALVESLEGGANGAARGDAVVDDDHGASADVDGAPAVTVRADALGHLALLLHDELGQLLLGHADELHRVPVDVHGPLLGHRANPELGLYRRADLAHDAHVERCIEGARDLVGDRDASSRKPEHDRLGSTVDTQALGQLTARVNAIDKDGSHAPIGFNIDATGLRGHCVPARRYAAMHR